MLNKETKQHIDNARDILVGQLPLPTDQVELITIALIYKFMDDIDVSAKELGGSATYFKGDLSQLSWRKIISNTLSAEERVTKFIASIEGISKAKHIPDLFKSIFKNTFLKFRDGRILKMFMDEIDWFTYSHSEELGNAFEYLLNTMGAQGDNGQFRTPRNIIDFIVEVVEPKKTDSILDPACGTGGFLISAYKHILWANTKGYEDYSVTLGNYNIEGKKIHKGNKLTQDERKALVKNIVGYDITPLMQRLSKVNMYLHDISNPIIQDYDTLSLDTRWNEKYDCILANPPFMTPKGGIQPHDKFRIKANTTEVLFSDYMLEHLTPNGKAGWIVPEGIIFQNNNDYVDLRRWLVEEAGLWAVVSLPAQIFQPYSGVKTSILLVDRKLARERDSIILVKVENDGFSLNTNRNPIDKNDLSGALKILRAYKSSAKTPPLTKGRTKEGSVGSIKYIVLPRREFEKIDSYKAYTTGWELCRKAFVKVTAARNDYDEIKKNKLTEKEEERAEKTWIRRWEEFRSRTNYNKTELGNETEFKFWFEENLKDACISYGEDPHATIKIKKGSVYFPEELKKSIDYQREFNLSYDKYTSNGKEKTNKSDWTLVNLGDKRFFSIESGGTPDTNNDRFWNGDISWVTLVDLPQENVITEIRQTVRRISKEGLDNSNAKLLPVDSVLVSSRATIGRIGINKIPLATNQGFKNIIINDISSVNTKYVAYVLTRLVDKMIELGSGATYKEISKSNFASLTIPLPPLEIQQKIVAEIEGYQKVIDGCNTVIENYKPTFKVDEKWPEYKLGELAIFQYGTALKEQDRKPGEFPVFGSNGIIGYHNKYLVESPFIVIGRKGTAGAITYSEKNGTPIDTTFYVKLSDESVIRLKFLYHLLKTLNLDKLNTQAGVPGLNRNDAYILNVNVPAVELQDTIVSQLDKEIVALENVKDLKSKMESQIKEVIDGVWGKAE